MLSLAERVYRTIQRHSLLPPGARVLVALSGGADSTALACVLAELAPAGGFSLAGAAHFNHRLRGAAADGDELASRALAERLGMAWRSEGADAAAAAHAGRLSLEEACRCLRYDFLARAAGDLGATHVAVGHTRDDQAETLLLQLFRGAGPNGLRAMVPCRGVTRQVEGGSASTPSPAAPPGGVRVVRPLLEVSHADLVSYLAARSIPFREDESNTDRQFLRNRVRHEVIPFLQARLSGSVARVLARDAAIASADAEYLESQANAAYRRIARTAVGRVELDRRALCEEPEAIARRVALQALGNLGIGRFVGFDQAGQLLALARGACRGPVSLPGATASVAGVTVVLEAAEGRGGRDSRRPGVGMNFSRSELSIPGEAVLPGTERCVSAFLRSLDEPMGEAELKTTLPAGTEAWVDAAVAVGLGVRRRRPGDWLRPLGLGGRKKLQDYFIDRKVPRDERDRVPLVVDARDRIVWVAGHGIDEEFRVGAGTHDVVILKLRGESA